MKPAPGSASDMLFLAWRSASVWGVGWVWVTRRHWPRLLLLLLLDQFFSSCPSVSFLIGAAAVTWLDTKARHIERGYSFFTCSLSFSLSFSPLSPYLQFSAAQWVIKPVCSPVWNNFTAAEICPNVPSCTDDWREGSSDMAKTGEAFWYTVWHILLMNDVESSC